MIGCAMHIHAAGSGFLEVNYQRALEIKFTTANAGYAREQEIVILYQGPSPDYFSVYDLQIGLPAHSGAMKPELKRLDHKNISETRISLV